MNSLTQPVVTDNPIAAGVDTHADVHVAAVIDHLGAAIAHASFDTTPAGHRQLLEWIASHGTLDVVGVEGTGAYGAGLCRFLHHHHVRVVEVDCPDRSARRLAGKSDPVDAYAAARAALSGRASGTPKTRDGNIEMIRNLRLARASAVKARAMAITQLKAIITTAPDTLREQLRHLHRAELITTCARLRPARHNHQLTGVEAATKRSLASIARRIQHLTNEIDDLEIDLDALVSHTAPNLVALFGVGTETAGQLLVTFGDNPQRIHSSAAFAHLCGVAPIPATSGKTTNRHRLNRGGDRQANRALHTIALCRLQRDHRTRNYRDRLTANGKTGRDVLRILKRAIAREIYQTITTQRAA